MSSTYGFGDVTLVVSHPAVGRFTAHGSGIGSVTFTMSTERTAHDVAADGTIMITKIEGNNGTIALAVQQTSSFQVYLTKLFNYLRTAPPSQWALIGLTLRSVSMQELINATGVSFQQMADKPFQQQGQQLTWTLMAANITQQNV